MTSEFEQITGIDIERLLDLARNVAALDSQYTAYNGVLPNAVREWQQEAREVLSQITN